MNHAVAIDYWESLKHKKDVEKAECSARVIAMAMLINDGVNENKQTVAIPCCWVTNRDRTTPLRHLAFICQGPQRCSKVFWRIIQDIPHLLWSHLKEAAEDILHWQPSNMGELNSCSLWMKLGVLFMVKAWALHMFSMCTPGWSTVSYLFNKVTSSKPGWLIGVEACEVIGYCCGLTAVVLILCLIFLDEVKSNKVAQICFIVFSIVAGEWLTSLCNWCSQSRCP